MLAVHALPDLVNPDFVNQTPSGRGKLLAVLLACALPLVLCYVIFVALRPLDQRLFGETIQPLRPLPAIELQTLDGKSVALSGLRKQWRLIGVGPSRCEDRCVKHLFIQRQLREMLLKKGVQVDRLWLVLGEGTLPERLYPLLKDAELLRITPDQLTEWLAVEPQQATAQLFIADPEGRLWLRMPADQDSAQVRSAMWTLQKLVTGTTSATAAAQGE